MSGDYRDRRSEKSSRFTDSLLDGVRSGAFTPGEASHLAESMERGDIFTLPTDDDMRIPARLFMAFVRTRQGEQPGIQPNSPSCAREKGRKGL